MVIAATHVASDIGRVVMLAESGTLLAVALPLVRYRWGRWRTTHTGDSLSLLLIDVALGLGAAQQIITTVHRVGLAPLWYGLPMGLAWQTAAIAGLWLRRGELRAQVAAHTRP